MTAYQQGMQYGYKKALADEQAKPKHEQNEEFIQVLNTLIL